MFEAIFRGIAFRSLNRNISVSKVWELSNIIVTNSGKEPKQTEYNTFDETKDSIDDTPFVIFFLHILDISPNDSLI